MVAFTVNTGCAGNICGGGRVHQPKAPDKTGRKVRFYAALGLVTAATLMLQIIETRIISVTSWYHLAFFVISIAMFGLCCRKHQERHCASKEISSIAGQDAADRSS